jgi:alpha/beta superfamily hydrolase
MRGVGASEGVSTGDAHEVQDAASALAWLLAAAPAARLSVCGYSFGSFTGLAAAEQLGQAPRFAFVAPVPRAFPYNAAFARTLPLRHVLLGDSDEFCSPEEARALAASFGTAAEFLPGASHALLAHRGKVAERVASVLLDGR